MALCGKYGAGDLKAKITLQRKARVADGLGGWTETWATVAQPWANWKALSGNELFAAQRINPRVSVKVAIRFRGDAYGAPYYSPEDRVMYRNREYAIVSVVDPDDGQAWLEMMLAEGAPS